MSRPTAASTAAAIFIMACLLSSGVIREATAAISCGQVASSLGQCVSYLTGQGPLLKPCCAGVQRLNAAASSTPDRRQACACLKSISGSISNLKPNLAAGLPGMCGVSIPYPISTTTDCSR
ncbi:Non-specific lipid-transfer protein 3 [Platanthera guangdongensis]|uniref:Non-specific lipid-transfer protein n=1 Tax=Platanthera guangdongensis TaxID=2320717 RepID=A0ABR2LUR3_9ASPA